MAIQSEHDHILMSAEEQRTFVTELCDSVRDTLRDDITAGKVPNWWTGLQLRRLLAQRFAAQMFPRMTRVQVRNFNREIINRNL